MSEQECQLVFLGSGVELHRAHLQGRRWQPDCGAGLSYSPLPRSVIYGPLSMLDSPEEMSLVSDLLCERCFPGGEV